MKRLGEEGGTMREHDTHYFCSCIMPDTDDTDDYAEEPCWATSYFQPTVMLNFSKENYELKNSSIILNGAEITGSHMTETSRRKQKEIKIVQGGAKFMI